MSRKVITLPISNLQAEHERLNVSAAESRNVADVAVLIPC